MRIDQERGQRETGKVTVLLVLLIGLIGLNLGCSARESNFTVLAYNVENFFDLDEVATFEDYEQDYPEDPFGYSRAKLLTKLQRAVAVLAMVNAGKGPDIILFQEFENDFTPNSAVTDFDAFLQRHRRTTVGAMLGHGWQPEYAGIPSVAWMAKAMADAGMTGYEIAVAPPKSLDTGIAHVNAVFSRFPILEANAHPIPQARDIQEVAVRISGDTLWLYNNHWKSGASNPEREPIRVENARVLRRLIDARLKADPQADIIVGGDLNSHYNHSILYPELTTGINDVLGSSGDESFSTNDLYNLWFELPPEARYSEVWRGRRGTLMHLLVSRGLYDRQGISYVDSSFNKLLLPGLNADALGRPLEWHFAGSTGGGVSDHFPVGARFSTVPFEAGAALATGDDAPDYEFPLGYEAGLALDLPDGAFLGELTDDELARQVDRLFVVEADVTNLDPVRLVVNQRAWPAYVPDKQVYRYLHSALRGEPLLLVVRPGFWKGERQLVVEGLK